MNSNLNVVFSFRVDPFLKEDFKFDKEKMELICRLECERFVKECLKNKRFIDITKEMQKFVEQKNE